MKVFKNPKKLNIGNTIKNFKDKITFKYSLKEMLKAMLTFFTFCTGFYWIILLILGATAKVPLILASAIVFGLPAIYVSGLFTLGELIERHINNKKANKEIDYVIETLKQNDINLTKEEINSKVEVTQMENSKGYEYLDNGEYKKRKRVIKYITINNNDKYKIIKEVTTYIRNVFYKKYSNKTYIMNEQDLINDGLITKDGKLTEKGKVLKLKKI